MSKASNRLLASVVALALLSLTPVVAQAAVTTITIPDVGDFQFFGTGAASVTYDGVVFSQDGALSNGNFFNIGSGFSGDPAVLSSQEQTVGVANILITLTGAVNEFWMNYGTFGGSTVNFLLSNGHAFSQASTGGGGYAVPDLFHVTDATSFTSVLVTSSDGVMDLNNVKFGSAVPEPATWALMLGGFGLAGAALRHRRRMVAA